MDKETKFIWDFLKDHHITLSEIWVRSCIAWCKEENLPPNYTLNELRVQVYEQWLLLDLRDLEVACLPPNLGKHKHHVLSGNYSVQIMQVVDISKPKLWQLQKIRNSNVLTRSVDPDENHGKRVLQLTLSDGVQEVEAMEYRPIPDLSINIRPGTKAKLIGPVTIRRGRIMLEKTNIKILGGEVEELLVSNAAENVLAKALNLPINENPFALEDETVRDEPSVPANNPRPTAIEGRRDQNERRLVERVGSMTVSQPSPPPSKKLKPQPMFDDIDFNPEDFEVMDKIISSTQAQPSTALSSSLDDDTFDDIVDAHLDNLDRQIIEKPPKVTTIPITKLLEHKRTISKGVFKIRAKFKSVVEKLTVDEEGYKLAIKVDDGSNELVVRVHSDVSTELSGYTAEALMVLKAGIKNQDQSSIQIFMKAMQALKEKLTQLDGILAIQVSRDEERPVLIKVVKAE